MKRDELIRQQKRLQVRSAALRIKLADQAQVFKHPLSIANQVLSGLQWLYRNPLWPLAGSLILLALRPQRLLLWSGRLWSGWKTFKLVQNWVAKLPRQKQP